MRVYRSCPKHPAWLTGSAEGFGGSPEEGIGCPQGGERHTALNLSGVSPRDEGEAQEPALPDVCFWSGTLGDGRASGGGKELGVRGGSGTWPALSLDVLGVGSSLN